MFRRRLIIRIPAPHENKKISLENVSRSEGQFSECFVKRGKLIFLGSFSLFFPHRVVGPHSYSHSHSLGSRSALSLFVV
jgi:hypothetical protein